MCSSPDFVRRSPDLFRAKGDFVPGSPGFRARSPHPVPISCVVPPREHETSPNFGPYSPYFVRRPPAPSRRPRGNSVYRSPKSGASCVVPPRTRNTESIRLLVVLAIATSPTRRTRRPLQRPDMRPRLGLGGRQPQRFVPPSSRCRSPDRKPPDR